MKRSKVLGLAVLSSVMLLTSCGNAPEVDYQYNSYLAGSPSTWNVHTWQTNDESVIMAYTETGLYDFVLNENKDGYVIIPEMAADDPIDISDTLTIDEVSQYGVNSDEGTKWKVSLNPLAKWEDGTPINADDYIYSMQQLLNPKMQNYRASSYYADTLQIGNAERYFKSNRKTYEQYSKYAPIMQEAGQTPEYYYSFSESNEVVKKISNQYSTIVEFFNDNIPMFERTPSLISVFKNYVHFEMITKTDGDGVEYEGIESITCTEEQKGYHPTKGDRNISTALNYLAQLFGASTDAEIAQYRDDLTYTLYQWPETKWDEVGLVKTGEYELTFYLQTTIEKYYMQYNLSGNWLVYKDLYEAGKTTSGNLTVTNYATKQNNYKAYGPYKLVRYQTDKVIILEKNENWYGYTDGKHVNQYKTNRVKLEVIPEHATALQMFLKGDLDDISLTAEDMKKYGFSSRLYTTPETYTQKLSFNTDWNTLVRRQKGSGYNKTIFTNHNFREAFSYAMDRELFAAQYTAGHEPSVVLLNSEYISDYSTNEVYRDTPQGKSVITDIYGDNVNGFSVSKAAELFQLAFNEEIAKTREGHLEAGQKVQIEILLYNDASESAQAQITFMRNCLAAATKGTSLEDKIEIKTRKDEDYYNTAYGGNFDCIWTIWGGMTMDPYSFMQVYTDENVRCEYGFYPSREQLVLEKELLKGSEDVSMSYDEWRLAISSGGQYSKDHEVRLNILAALEKAIILRYETISITSRASAELVSWKVILGTEKYIPLVGRGGIRYIDYRYNATEWANVKKQGLDYTI